MPQMEYSYKGLMSPVFTPFHDNKERSVNYDQIDPYAKNLKEKGVPAILVNGTAGEGVSQTLEERKKVTETWLAACKKYDLRMMVQIGGGPFTQVAQLAAHAESLKIEAILCLPELYFKPNNEEEAVAYLKRVSEYCANTPLLYYHIPKFTNVSLNMPRFCNLAEKEISNFVGIKFSSSDLDQGASCLKPGRSVFLGSPKVLAGGLALGFDSSIMTTLNICPELPIEIFKLMNENKLIEAGKLQIELSRQVDQILKNGPLVSAMKHASNKANPHVLLGPPRYPFNPVVEK